MSYIHHSLSGSVCISETDQLIMFYLLYEVGKIYILGNTLRRDWSTHINTLKATADPNKLPGIIEALSLVNYVIVLVGRESPRVYHIQLSKREFVR